MGGTGKISTSPIRGRVNTGQRASQAFEQRVITEIETGQITIMLQGNLLFSIMTEKEYSVADRFSLPYTRESVDDVGSMFGA